MATAVIAAHRRRAQRHSPEQWFHEGGHEDDSGIALSAAGRGADDAGAWGERRRNVIRRNQRRREQGQKDLSEAPLTDEERAKLVLSPEERARRKHKVELVYAARKIQRNYRRVTSRRAFDAGMKPWADLQKDITEVKTGITFLVGAGKTGQHLGLFILFIIVLVWQKNPTATFGTNAMILETLANAEWSEGYAIADLNSLAGNDVPPVSIPQALWRQIRQITKAFHHGVDLDRLDDAALHHHYDVFHDDFTRNLHPYSNETFEDAYLRVVGGDYPPPLGSRQMSNYHFTKSDVFTLEKLTQKHVGHYYHTPQMPASCQALPFRESAGLDAYNGGMDFLPHVPLYGHFEDSAGYVFGNAKTIGMMEVRQYRRKTQQCPRKWTERPGIGQECRSFAEESEDDLRPYSLTHGPGRNVNCTNVKAVAAAATAAYLARNSGGGGSSSSSSSSSGGHRRVLGATSAASSTPAAASTASAATLRFPNASSPQVEELFQRLSHDSDGSNIDGLEPFCYDKPHHAYIARFDLGTYAFPLSVVLCQMDLLEAEKWINHETKHVEIRNLLYHSDTELWTQVVVAFDVRLGGFVDYHSSVHTIGMRDYYADGSDYVRLVFEIIYCIWNVFYMISLYRQWRFKNSHRDLQVGAEEYVTLASLIVVVVQVGAWINFWQVAKTFHAPESNSLHGAIRKMTSLHDEFDSGLAAYSFYRWMNGLSCLLGIVRLMMIFTFHERLAVISETMGEIWTDLWQFMLVFMINVLLVAFMCWILLGEYMWEFRSISWSIHTIIDANFGNMPDYEEMWRREPFWGPFLYYFVVIAMEIFAMNFLLAIIVDGFILVKEKLVNAESLGDTILKTAQTAVRHTGLCKKVSGSSIADSTWNSRDGPDGLTVAGVPGKYLGEIEELRKEVGVLRQALRFSMKSTDLIHDKKSEYYLAEMPSMQFYRDYYERHVFGPTGTNRAKLKSASISFGHGVPADGEAKSDRSSSIDINDHSSALSADSGSTTPRDGIDDEGVDVGVTCINPLQESSFEREF